MQHGESIKDGAQLASIVAGYVLTSITMNTLIGLITLCGGALYALNQASILYKTIKNRKKK